MCLSDTPSAAGKDISQKLYRVAEGLGGSRHWDGLAASRRRSSGPFSPLQLRSNSVDRVHTGTKGLMRSQVWLGSNSRRGSHAAAGADALGEPPPPGCLSDCAG